MALQRETDALVEESERALQKSKGEKETLDKEISEAEKTLRELKEAYEKVKKLLIIIIIYYLYGANYMWI